MPTWDTPAHPVCRRPSPSARTRACASRSLPPAHNEDSGRAAAPPGGRAADRGMELAGFDDVLERLDLGIGRKPGQILVDVELEPEAEEHRGRDAVDLGDRHGI